VIVFSQHKINYKYLLQSIFVLVLLFNTIACDQGEESTSASMLLPDVENTSKHNQVPVTSLLEKIKQRGKLIILTTNLPTTYYFDRDNQLTGPEYEMTQSFAKSIQVEVEYKVYESIKEVLNALRNNEGDIAANGFTVNDKRKIEFDFGPVYQKINEYVVCHRSKKRIKNKSELNGLEIIVAADSSYIESLKLYPDMLWTDDQDLNTENLLKQVAQKKIQCTISDSTLYNIERRYHTEIQNKYTLAKESELAWMLNKNNDKLKQAVYNWFEGYKNNGELSSLLEKYYGFVEIFDYVDTHKFLKRVKTRLPKYKDFFIDAANKNEIDPSLLAAQSYQESHWNRKAKSPTGVRGIMMLTQPVAKSLGVTNRLHAEQNIYAGAKFQAKMKKMVDDVNEPDRTWLALAAYNVGRGHFRDAQSLARKMNKNPDRWNEMKEVLPLLSQKKYYKDLRYGYARGNEPVRYVTRIRNYDELLHRYFSKQEK
jgi:membrane-bound lytic murein transglycosylase F